MVQNLSFSAKNDTVVIQTIKGDGKQRLRLEAFGLYEGAILNVIYTDHNRIVVRIGNTNVGMSQKLAKIIEIVKKPCDLS